MHSRTNLPKFKINYLNENLLFSILGFTQQLYSQVMRFKYISTKSKVQI